jgi:hypothetical protein
VKGSGGTPTEVNGGARDGWGIRDQDTGYDLSVDFATTKMFFPGMSYWFAVVDFVPGAGAAGCSVKSLFDPGRTAVAIVRGQTRPRMNPDGWRSLRLADQSRSPRNPALKEDHASACIQAAKRRS